MDGKASTSHTQAISTVTGLQTALDAKANLAGATFTGKVNTTTTATTAPINLQPQGTAPNTTVAGDVWIGNFNMFFRDANGNLRTIPTQSTSNVFSSAQVIDTTASTPGLRITQKGAGSALVVEDSTTPDSDALIVDANGNLGIGVSNNPGSIWTGSTYKMEVLGAAYVSGNLQVGDGATIGGTLRVPYQIDVGTVNDLALIVQSSISFPNYGGTLAGFTTQTNAMGTSGNVSFSDYPMEIVIKLNSNLYAIPCRNIV